MYLCDDFGSCECKKIVVSRQKLRCCRKSRSAEIRLNQLIALNHRTHSAIKNEDALGEGGAQRGYSLSTGKLFCHAGAFGLFLAR